MPIAKPGKKRKLKDRSLTVGQYKNILRTFARVKRGADPEGHQTFADIMYNVSDYYDNVDKKGYDHTKYMQYLFKNKDVPRELLKLVPGIKY